jgi:hypothetical protein
MPCLLAILAVAFPRIAIILLWLFTTFFTGLYNNLIIPILGFIFLPLTLIVYTYMVRMHPITQFGQLTATELVILFVAVIIDLGLLGGGAAGRGRR